MRPTAAFRRALVVLGVSYFALWACGPTMSGPPPAPMIDGKQLEVGIAGSLAATLVDGRGGVTLDTSCPFGEGSSCGPSGQLWFRYDKSHFDLDVRLFGGGPSLVGLGGSLAWRVVDKERVFVAPRLSGGFAYAGLGLPVGVSVAPRTWLVFTPEAVVRLYAPFRLSEGVWHTLPSGLSLGVELGQGFSPNGAGFDVAAQVGFQF